MQMIDSDDAIIAEHVRAAEVLLRAALRTLATTLTATLLAIGTIGAEELLEEILEGRTGRQLRQLDGALLADCG
jgi:hypothetical protein